MDAKTGEMQIDGRRLHPKVITEQGDGGEPLAAGRVVQHLPQGFDLRVSEFEVQVPRGRPDEARERLRSSRLHLIWVWG